MKIFVIFFLSVIIVGADIIIKKIRINPPLNITIPPIKEKKLQDFSFSINNATVKPFDIAQYEITKQQYYEAIKKPYDADEDDLDEPMVYVDFDQAQKVCNYYHGRLPTELEWIVAAGIKVAPSHCFEFVKQGSFSPFAIYGYPLKEDSSILSCYMEDDDELEADLIGSELLSVTQSYENINGTYGMLGNVWEWVDTTKEYFFQSYKIIKGGSFANANEKELFDVRVSNPIKADTKQKNIGFRCVWDVK